MRSKTSKALRSPFRLWTAAHDYSEEQLKRLAVKLASELLARDRVFLEGPMGAGKSTFARFLLQALGVFQAFEGSPTFALAHEYQARRSKIIHVDFYRLINEEELDHSGIVSYYWETDAIIVSEWISNWPEFQKQVEKTGRVWKVGINLSEDSDRREVKIEVKSNND